LITANNGKPRWLFYLAWVGLNFIAILIACLIAWALISLITNIVANSTQLRGESFFTDDSYVLYVIFPLIGLSTGFLQYTLLRRYFPHMAWWIAATFIGWLMPLATGPIIISLLDQRNDTFAIMFGLLLMGASIVVPQWWLLRKRVGYASWWILAHGLGWSATGLFSLVDAGPLPVLVAIALLPAIATGFACWLLLDWLPRHGSEAGNS